MGVSAAHLGSLAMDEGGGSYGFGEACSEAIPSWIVMILCIPACLFTFGLLIFHTILVRLGKTTHEKLKNSSMAYHAFTRGGLCSNLVAICSTRASSLIHLPRYQNTDADLVASSPSHSALRQGSFSGLSKGMISARQEAEPLTHCRSPALTSDA